MSKRKDTLFFGTATALVTPFCNGRLDFETMGRLIDRQIDAGIDALVIAGTTGESATLSDPEKIALFAFAAERIHGRIPMIAGVGCADTAHTVTIARSACAAGADALLVVTPFYNRPSQAGLRAHFEAVADAAEKPIILYSVPKRTGITIDIDTYRALAEHPNIWGVKEANTDMLAIGELTEHCADRLDIYAGCDELILPVMLLGGIGSVSVLSNLVPEQVRNVTRLWKEGKPRLATAKYSQYRALINALSLANNPISVKTALALMGLCREEFRLPLCPMEEPARKRLCDEMRNYRLLPAEDNVTT